MEKKNHLKHNSCLTNQDALDSELISSDALNNPENKHFLRVSLSGLNKQGHAHYCHYHENGHLATQNAVWLTE